MEYFKNLPNLGNLNLKWVLLEFEDQPILFVCSSASNDTKLFICLCSEIRTIYRWIVSTTTISNLSRFNRGEIDVLALIAEGNEPRHIIESDEQGEIVLCKPVTLNDFDPLDLPEKNVYFDYDPALNDFLEAENHLPGRQKIEIHKSTMNSLDFQRLMELFRRLTELQRQIDELSTTIDQLNSLLAKVDIEKRTEVVPCINGFDKENSTNAYSANVATFNITINTRAA